MMLLVAIVTGAKADELCSVSLPSNLTAKTGSGIEGSNCTYSYAIEDPTKSSNVKVWNEKSYYKFGSAGNVTITYEAGFQAGDKVTVELGNQNTAQKNIGFLLKSSNGNGTTANVAASTATTMEYTLTAADIETGGKTIKIYRGGSNSSDARFLSFTVTGTRSSKPSPGLTITSASSILLSKSAESAITYTSNSDGTVTFSSGSTSVATVSNTGVITAVGGGTTTITVSQAETDTYSSGSAIVEVYVPYDVATGTEFTIGSSTVGFSYPNATAYLTNGFSISNSNNKTYQSGSLSGSIKYSAGTTYTINIPEGVSIMSATVTGRSNYTSSETDANWGTLFGTDYSSEALPYSNQDPAEKVINFESAQTGTLTFTPGGNQVQFIIVLSTEAQTVVPVTGVTIDEAAEVEAGKTVTPVYTVLPEDATNKSVTWSSDDESVATVENGVVTGVAAGTANITVTTVDGNFSDVCVVTVTAPVPVEKTLPYSEDFTTWGGTTWSQGDTSTPDVIKGITFYSKSGSKQFSASGDGLTFPNNNIGSNNYFMAIQLTGVENSKIKITLTPASTSGKAAVKYILKDGETEVGTPGNDVIEATAANEGEDIVIFADCTNNDAILYLGRKSSDDQNKTFESIAIDFAKSNAITLNSNGFATYSSAYDFEYTGADAYGMELTATSLSGTKVTTGKIKAGEGILFKGEANATVTITESTGAAALENNSLIGTTDINNEVISPLSYTHKYALNGDTFKTFTGALVANKAFFGTNEELNNSLDLVFDGATAVEAIAEANEADAEVPVKVIKNGQLYIGNYNVAGARVK